MSVLARVTLGGIRLSTAERRQREDLLQTAAVAGLGAIRSAQARGVRPARRFVLLAMQAAVYRELHRPQPDQIEDDGGHVADPDTSADHLAIRDALDRWLPLIAPGVRVLLERWVGGESLDEIGATIGLGRTATWNRIDAAVREVRRVALDTERAADGQAVASAVGCDSPTGCQNGGGGWAGGGKNHFPRPGRNGWASKFSPRAGLRELSVRSSEVFMAEHTHLLLERLISATEATRDEMQLIRRALAVVAERLPAPATPSEGPEPAAEASPAGTPLQTTLDLPPELPRGRKRGHK